MKHFYLLLISISFYSHSAIRYVTPTGAGSMNGSNWTNAYPGDSLQKAITLSGIGDEVWTATGIYFTTKTTNRAIYFSMKNGVTIYGSFAGTETVLSQRVLTAGLSSTLSAEIGVAGTNDNSYHTISNIGLNNTAIIDGFIIRDANDNRTASLNVGLGGGIYNDGAGSVCSPTIRNCIITNNQAVFGAGIFNNGYAVGNASPIIMNCIISTNTATSGGGGIDNFGVGGTASPTITNCVFYNNTASQRAGGMYCWGGNNGNTNPIVVNSVFVNNSAVDGGAIICDRTNTSTGSSGNSNPNFRNCIFWGNTASGIGPQFFTLGGATFIATYTDIDMAGQTTPHIISGVGTGTINSNPQFTNIASGAGLDGKWITADDGLRLQNASPCVNTGNNLTLPPTDILNNPRIFNVTVDMGAYEFGSTSTSIFERPETKNVVVYPNPAKGNINFLGLENSDCRAKIINTLGTIVKDCDLKNTSLNISELAAGLYLILIETADQTIIKQQVINE